MLSKTKITGTLGELEVAQRLISNGFDVFFPFGDCSYADLLAVKNGRTLMMQVKTVNQTSSGVVGVSATKWSQTHHKHRKYDSVHVDYIVCVALDRNRVAFIPMEKFQNADSVSLRFEPAKNGQQAVHLFEAYENLPL